MKRKAKEVATVATEAVKKTATPKKKPAAAAAPAFIARTPLHPTPNLSLLPGENKCNIVCWNVAGLRGTLKNNSGIFDKIVEAHQPHIICLQETKLQPTHEADIDADESLLPGYRKFWASSVTKKGYSGTALFIKSGMCMDIATDNVSSNDKASSEVEKPTKQKSIASFFGAAPKTATKKTNKKATATAVQQDQKCEEKDALSESLSLQEVSRELPEARFSGEGRTITAEFDKFYLVNCYVPNSGQSLDRLDYRTKEWDPYIYNHLKQLELKKPVIFAGDLNVAHLDLDIHNPGAKHLVKTAGVTPQERSSFSELLATGFQDALRYFYPEHEGQFTYWSQRTNARPVNKGLRLDYFMCSRSMFPAVPPTEENAEAKQDDVKNEDVRVLDSTIIFEGTEGCSDHCPVLLSLAVR